MFKINRNDGKSEMIIVRKLLTGSGPFVSSSGGGGELSATCIKSVILALDVMHSFWGPRGNYKTHTGSGSTSFTTSTGRGGGLSST
jgi:hypothetical protein